MPVPVSCVSPTSVVPFLFLEMVTAKQGPENDFYECCGGLEGKVLRVTADRKKVFFDGKEWNKCC